MIFVALEPCMIVADMLTGRHTTGSSSDCMSQEQTRKKMRRRDAALTERIVIRFRYITVYGSPKLRLEVFHRQRFSGDQCRIRWTECFPSISSEIQGDQHGKVIGEKGPVAGIGQHPVPEDGYGL